MAIEIFRLPTTEFGKGICHMFLESSRQSLHKATKGNQRLGRQQLQNAINNDRKKVSITKLLVTKSSQLPYEWQLKMGFNCHPRNLDHWMATKINYGHQKLMTERWQPIIATDYDNQKLATKNFQLAILWRPNLFSVTIRNKCSLNVIKFFMHQFSWTQLTC